MLSLLRASAGHPLRPALAVLFAVFLASACQAAEPSAPVATNQVDLPRSYKFAPEDIVVPAGTTVTWTNNDFVDHTTTSDGTGWNSGVVAPGGKFSVTFRSAGSFPYHCTIHPGMVGTVVVR